MANVPDSSPSDTPSGTPSPAPAGASSLAVGEQRTEVGPSLGEAPTLLGAVPLQAPPIAVRVATPATPRAFPTLSRKQLRIAIAAAGVVVVLLVALLVGLLRDSYRAGAVFAYVPADCERFEYIHFAAIDALPAVAAVRGRRNGALEAWAEDLDTELRRSGASDGATRRATLRVLKDKHLLPYGIVREVALCEFGSKENGTEEGANEVREQLLVVGGHFRGEEGFEALRLALQTRYPRADDAATFADLDGRPATRVRNGRLAVLAGRSIVLVGKSTTLQKVLKQSSSSAHDYGATAADLLLRTQAFGGSNGNKERAVERLRWSDKKVQLLREGPLSQDEESGKVTAHLHQAALALRRNEAFEGIAKAYDRAEVRVRGRQLLVEYALAEADLEPAVHLLVDAGLRDARGYRAMVGEDEVGALLHLVLRPGVDYLDTRLSFW